MKTLLTVLLCLSLPLIGADKKPLIADPIVEKAVRKELDKPTGELTKADLEAINRLPIESVGLTETKGLEVFTQLKELYLSVNELTKLPEGLEKLTKLTILSLGANQLTDVKGLEVLTQLKQLHLSYNKLTDVKGLEKLTKLERLYLQGNQLTDVKGLENLTQLKVLILEDNPDLTKAQIDELKKALPKCNISSNFNFDPSDKNRAAVKEAIRKAAKKPAGELSKADFDQITELDLNNTQITDIDLREMAKLKNLTSLNLGRTQITDASLKKVARLKNLTVLSLYQTKITDAGLKEVAEMKQLAILRLKNNKLTNAGVAHLQKALPKCKIISNPKK